jgi:hypothetical protein
MGYKKSNGVLNSHDPEPLRKRILRKVSVDEETKCWVWSGALSVEGAPIMKVGGRVIRVRRVSYYAFRGVKLTKNHLLYMQCDNQKCVNPNHVGTEIPEVELERRRASPSMTGVFKASESWKGSKNPYAKLDEVQVKAIILEYRKRKYLNRYRGCIGDFYKEYADKYKVSEIAIANACRRKAWKHVNIGSAGSFKYHKHHPKKPT